jgi:regulator of protease activity HflC (stomatin/prohibitin superfamily)
MNPGNVIDIAALKRAREFARWFPVLLVAMLLVLFAWNCFVYIRPGSVGVLIHRSGAGVDKTPLDVGFHFKWPVFQEVVEYPVYMQTLVLTRSEREGNTYNEEINVNSVEGQPVSCDVSLSFELDPTRVPFLYSSFRTTIGMITHGFVKQSIRQALQEVVGRTEIVNFLGKDKALVVSQTQNDLQKHLGEYGFLVKQFTLNEVRAPESIVKAIEAKNTMAQEALRAQNELQKKQFEAQQKIIEAEGDAKSTLTRARAQAESNQLLSASLTAQLVEYRKIDKWNGQLPQVSGGATPFLNLQKQP